MKGSVKKDKKTEKYFIL